jgi:phosphoribosyl-ATP pyrophosphohydrolase/phosphoribosyl-AMP cyclohydrolase/histidinol dehydrogenase
VRTWLRIDDPTASQELVKDAVALGRHEGLEGHARSAERRLR